MSDPDTVYSGRMLRMECSFADKNVFLKSATVEEGLSKITETTVEFLAKDRGLDLSKVAGSTFTLFVKNDDDSERKFIGTCVSVRFLGLSQGFGHFEAKVRPWLWFLTLGKNNRIFQEMSAREIIKQIFSEAGFSSFSESLSATYAPRTYCVQYGESDYDFICRLMEEEGIYFYFTHADTVEKLVLADGVGAHSPIAGDSTVEHHYREKNYRRTMDHIFEWAPSEAIVPGAVAMTDYNFVTPSSSLMKVTSVPKGSHSHKAYEIYHYPGHHDTMDAGGPRSKVALEATAVAYQTYRAACNVRTMAAGATFKLKNHPHTPDNSEFLVTNASHQLRIETDYDKNDADPSLLGVGTQVTEDLVDSYRCIFEAIPKATQFRAPKVTPWPVIPGMQTAKVMGPSGEEIHTDEYGRIKVKFHWDRNTANDDTCTCWVRCVMPWTGSGWGMVAIPRVGQEVAIMFEEGDPDRPICTGMLYHAETMPPKTTEAAPPHATARPDHTLPASMTQVGIKTHSTKGGSATTYSELMFEDKKGAEFVRLQSEKDYYETIKNNAIITIGMEKQDAGDLTQTIYNHRTETVKMGDSTFTVETGSEFRTIKTDQTEDIGQNVTRTIGSNRTETVDGNHTETVKGNEDVTVKGNSSLTVSGKRDETVTGNITEKSSASTTIEATTKMTLKVGGSSIELTPAGITLKSTMIKIEASAMLQTKGPFTEVKADGLLILKGGLTLIN